MAIAFDAASTGSSPDAASLTFSHTCAGSNRVLILAVCTFDTEAGNSPQIPTATYDGVALTQLATQTYGFQVGAFNQSITLLALVAPATGTNDLVISLAGDSDELAAAATSWTGVDQATPFGTASSGRASGATSVSRNISSEADDLVIDAVGIFNPDTLTVGAGQTERVALNSGSGVDTVRQSTEPGAATVTMSWSVSTAGNFGHAAVNMNQATGGAVSASVVAVPADATSDALAPVVSALVLTDVLAFFDLTDLPADFGNAETAEIVVRTRGVDIGATPLKLFAQLFQSDETTPLSDEVEVASHASNSSFANSSPISLTGVNTIASKSVWDNARVRFRWGVDAGPGSGFSSGFSEGFS